MIKGQGKEPIPFSDGKGLSADGLHCRGDGKVLDTCGQKGQLLDPSECRGPVDLTVCVSRPAHMIEFIILDGGRREGEVRQRHYATGHGEGGGPGGWLGRMVERG